VLTPSSPPPGAHHFPRDKNDRPTRLLPQGRATVISTTKVPIGQRSGSPYPAITYRQAAVALDVSYTTVWRTFRAMQEAKLIERTGSDRRGTWRIPTPPQLSHE
ncbi:hypothetical protein, partial [Bifidobacterium longum]|uniref:hypothetical protein n=1 Tax=Bifidobacterium longum TaxID=216816 RepID=UPI002E78106F